MSSHETRWAPGTFFHLHEEDPVEEYNNFKLGMWIFLATEVLLFGGLFVAFFIFHHRFPEVFKLGATQLDWRLGATNTAVLLASSFTMAMAVDAAQRGLQGRLKLMLALTLVGGLGFLGIKYLEWGAKYDHEYFPILLEDGKIVIGQHLDIFFSIYFMTTGLHLLHVLIGMSFIALLLVRSLDGRYNEKNFGGVEVGGLYWHLVDVIWIFLFPLLYLI